jgi:aspartate carbamoyltransferase catalytic subunit
LLDDWSSLSIIKQKYFYRSKSGVRQFYFFQTNFLTCRAEDGPVERYIVTADTAIDELQRLTISRLQAKTTQQMITTMKKHHIYAVFDETTGKMLQYRHLIKHPDPKVREQ